MTLSLLSAFGCGGSDLILPTEPGVPAAITAIRGDDQAGSAGSPLPDSIVVRVTDVNGNPVAGQQVEFSLASAAPAGTVTPQTSTTGADGTAGARWVLGETIGAQSVVARVVGDGVPDHLEVRFTASVVPLGADRIAGVGGNAQSGFVGSTLSQPLQVRVTTAAGDPREGVSVAWVAPDGGTVSATSSTTNAEGIAETHRTLGSTPGIYVTTATVAGAEGSPVTFTSSAISGAAPGSLALRTQPSDSVSLGAELDRQPEVQIRDNTGGDVKQRGVPVTVAIASGNGSLGGLTTRLTNDSGIAEFTDLRIEGAAGTHVLIFAAPGYTSVTSEPVEVRPSTTSQAPVVVDDEYNTIEGFDHTLTVSAADGVLHNDRDPEGSSLTASSPSNPPHGSVSLSSDGSFSYAPDPSFFGDDQFTYRASDQSGNSSTGSVVVHVAPINDPPRFRDQGDQKVKSDAGPQTVRRWATRITPGAPNETEQTLVFEVSNDNPGLFTPGGQPAVTREGQSEEGTLTFEPAPGQAGSARVTVVLKDNGGRDSGGSDTSGQHIFTIKIGN